MSQDPTQIRPNDGLIGTPSDDPAYGLAPTAPPGRDDQNPSVIKSIFIGPNGIRAGWRLLIFVVIVPALILLTGLIARMFLRPSPPADPSAPQEITASLLAVNVVVFLLIVAAVFIMSRIERRPMRTYGLMLRGAFGGNFWIGAAAGFLAITVLLLAISAFGDFHFGQVSLAGADIMRYGLLWGGSFLMTGFLEEYLFRGYPLFTLTTGIGFWPATILLGLVFALAHRGNANENWLGLFEIVPIALFFSLTLRRTGTLWFAIGYHAAWDWGESYFYGIPDSGLMVRGHLLTGTFKGSSWITGGSAGPEGSILVLPLTLLVIWLFHMAYRKAKYPDVSTVPSMRTAAQTAT